MNSEYKDFIGIYDGALTSDECDAVLLDIKHVFITADPSFILHGEQQFNGSRLKRYDFSFHGEAGAPNAANIIKQKLHNCVLHYIDKFFAIQQTPMISTEVKFQKTPVSGGYHDWHYESDCQIHATRVLAWLVYLNDMGQNDGETEFLYQQRRVQAKAGRCVIWPAAFTHLHRGNPVYSGDKYVVTGWYTMAS